MNEYAAGRARGIGRAYGLFDCRSSRGAIAADVPVIRRLVLTPPEVGLSLSEGGQNHGYRYRLGVEFPDATNSAAAREAGGVLNQLYQSPHFRKGEPFAGEILN
jgi:hypothetical protein